MRRPPEHRRVLVEMAWPEDAKAIEQLAWKCGSEMSLDWSRLGNHWLVCKWRGRVVGAVQVLLGLPIGRLEFLCVEPSLGFVQRGIVVRDLLVAGLAAHREYGAQAVAGTVAEQFTNILTARDGAVMDRGAVVGWRV